MIENVSKQHLSWISDGKLVSAGELMNEGHAPRICSHWEMFSIVDSDGLWNFDINLESSRERDWQIFDQHQSNENSTSLGGAPSRKSLLLKQRWCLTCHLLVTLFRWISQVSEWFWIVWRFFCCNNRSWKGSIRLILAKTKFLTRVSSSTIDVHIDVSFENPCGEKMHGSPSIRTMKTGGCPFLGCRLDTVSLIDQLVLGWSESLSSEQEQVQVKTFRFRIGEK